MELNLDSAISLSSARLFKRTLTLFTPHWPRTIQDAKQPAQLQNHTCKINDYQLFSTTRLDLYTHAAPMPKHFTHWKHQQMRWETVYIDQIVSKAEAQGLQTLYHWWKCAKILLLCFQTVGQNKILIVAFLPTYFILNILLPCSSVSSLICPSESCAALVVHDLANPCFWAHAGVCFMLMVLIRWMLHFTCSNHCFTVFLVGMRTDAFRCLKALLRHTPWKYSTCNLFFFCF